MSLKRVELRMLFDFDLPAGAEMEDVEKQVIVQQTQSFVQWMLNEWIRSRTGQINYFGSSALQAKEQNNANKAH